MKFVGLLITLLIIVGCSKSSNTESPTSPGTNHSKDPNSGNKQQNNSPIQTLKIYDGSSSSLNTFHAVNVDPGKLFFDFDYTPLQDEALALDFESVKSTLIGCANSDIGFGFTLHQKNADGKIDLSSYEGLGPAPVEVTKGTPYIVRVSLDVRKSCLGIAYSFKIESSN